MGERHHQQELIGKGGSGKSPFTFLDFFMKSTLLAMTLTFPPIISLIVIWEFGATTPAIMIGWVMFALFWTFYSLLKLSQRFI